MASDWKDFVLGNMCEKIGSGATPRGGKESYKTRGIALIRSQNVYNHYFSYDGLAYIDEDQADKLANVEIKLNDVLLNITGDSVARCCQVPNQLLPARVNQHVAIIRPNPKSLDARYLFYYLVSPTMQSHMLVIAGAGATRNALTKGMIENLKIILPPLPEQRAIAEVLGALDDKIELNRRMNDTLEAIARAVFRRWFVEDTEVKGWEEKTIGDICEFAYGKGLKEDKRLGGAFPVYGSNGQIGWHNDYLVKGPGIVVGRKGNPGIITWAQKNFFPIDTTFYVVPKDKEISFYWLYYVLIFQCLVNLGADSAVPGLNRNIAYMSNIFYPPPEIMKFFDDFTKPIFNNINANDEQSRTLAALRDALLPKLMRGEVRVKVIS